MGPDFLKFFAEIIYKISGIPFQDKDYFLLESRLSEFMKHIGVATPEELMALYKEPLKPEFKNQLINACIISDTLFLRDKKSFMCLIDPILKKFESENKTDTFKIWSAGCSTGQEPISILLAIDMKMEKLLNRISVKGTDISTIALEKAKKGVYSGEEVQRGLAITLLLKYFEQLSKKFDFLI